MLRPPSDVSRSRVDVAIDAAVVTGVGILILVGFATSYRTLLELAVTAGGYPGWLAPAVPLSFDLGIVVLSLKVAQAAREGRQASVLRLLVSSLSALTVVVNASAVPGVAGRLLHTVPPAMFVICFETVIMTVRRRALQSRGAWPEPVPRQRAVRWVLAPQETWRVWRSSVLQPAPAIEAAALKGREATSAERPLPAGESPVEGVDGRLSAAVAALRHDPGLTADALRTILKRAGFTVSLRTAQRIRAAAVTAREQPPRPG